MLTLSLLINIYLRKVRLFEQHSLKIPFFEVVHSFIYLQDDQ